MSKVFRVQGRAFVDADSVSEAQREVRAWIEELCRPDLVNGVLDVEIRAGPPARPGCAPACGGHFTFPLTGKVIASDAMTVPQKEAWDTAAVDLATGRGIVIELGWY